VYRQLGRLLVYKWRHFRVHENVADALRNTIVVLLPLLTLYMRYPEAAVGIAVGALLISLTDLPGNRLNKTLTALQSLAIILVTSVIISLFLSPRRSSLQRSVAALTNTYQYPG